MARSKIFGNLVNSFVNTILNSPLHSLMSEHSLAVHYMSRESGKKTSFPAYFYQHENAFYILVEKKEEWWRSLKGGATIKVTIKGNDHRAWAEAVHDEAELKQILGKLLKNIPELRTELDVHLDDSGALDEKEQQILLQYYSIIKIQIQTEQA
ncbi:MAG: hypothetical protein GYA52_09250 [Chloroflexi bacterium]|nr:hypothetical protein [Chloroflexota bacterium]